MSDRQIIALTLGLNGIYLVALFGFVTFRLVSGLSFMPDGYGPLATASAIIVPTACIGLSNFLKQRRNC
jgi:hypothetical protein